MSETRDLDLSGEPLFKRTEVRLYRKEPDYSRPLLSIPGDKARVIKEKLELLYRDQAEACYSEIERILRVHHTHKTTEILEDEEAFRPEDRFTEKDIVAITYPDQLVKPGVPPLAFLGSGILGHRLSTSRPAHGHHVVRRRSGR